MTSVLSHPNLQRINKTDRMRRRLDPLQSIAFGMSLGLSLAVPPGPVNAVIATEGAEKAYKGTLVGLGALTADALFLVLTLTLGAWLPAWARKPLTLVGGGVFVLLAILVLRSHASAGRPAHMQYLAGLTMGLTNPFQIAWWLTAGLTLITSFGLPVAVGFFAGIVLWITTFPQAVHRGVLAFGGRFLAGVKILSGGLLAAYGIWFIYLFLV
jgi:threonine/homoserine/homoserine lactone efflux protein